MEVMDNRLFEQLRQNEHSLGMYGFKGIVFRGIELDSFSLGFNTDMVTEQNGVQLVMLQFRRYLLVKWVYAFVEFWHSLHSMNMAIREFSHRKWDSAIVMMIWLLQVAVVLPLFVREFLLDILRRSTVRPIDTQQIIIRLSEWQLQNRVPRSIAFLLDTPKFLTPLPPPVPEAYLTADKKLVTPGVKEVEAAVQKQKRYRDEFLNFKKTTNFDTQIKASKTIGHCYVMDNISLIKFFQPYGDIWEDAELDLVQLVLVELKNLLAFDLGNVIDTTKKLNLRFYDADVHYALDATTLTYIESPLQAHGGIEEGLSVCFISKRQSFKTLMVSALHRNIDFTQTGIDPHLSSAPELIVSTNTTKDSNLIYLQDFPYHPQPQREQQQQHSDKETVLQAETCGSLSFDTFYGSLEKFSQLW